MEMSDLPQPAPQTWRSLQVRGLRRGAPFQAPDCVAEERPVAFEFNGIAHAVMMATPADLEDFAYGFALSEGIVDRASQVHDFELLAAAGGHTLQVRIASECFARLKERRRSLTGRTGCGLCGTESLAHALRLPPALPAGPVFAAPAVARAMGALRTRQLLLQLTGATHAAAWCTADGEIALLREDVGRHNALDKLVGALARTRQPAAQGFIAVTSRASYEMVQKTAQAGVGLLVAVSGVTGLAVEVAAQAGLALAGFARGDDLCVYTEPDRISWNPTQCTTPTPT